MTIKSQIEDLATRLTSLAEKLSALEGEDFSELCDTLESNVEDVYDAWSALDDTKDRFQDYLQNMNDVFGDLFEDE